MLVLSVKISGISDGICWNLWENVADVCYIKKKVSINMQIFEVSDVSDCSYCNSKVNSETETYAANLIFVW